MNTKSIFISPNNLRINSDAEQRIEIEKHINQYLGKIDNVFHEIVSDQLHIDILHIEPNEKRNCHTFVTCGMSDYAMYSPIDPHTKQYCELMISLPADWQLDPDFDHENNWPIKVLKQIARMPYEQNSWIGYGHTIQNGNPEAHYPGNLRLSNMLVVYPISVPQTDKFIKLDLENNKSIRFYCLIPITSDEADLVKKKGIDSLLDYFDKYKLKDIVLNRRISFLVAKRKIRAMKVKLGFGFILILSVVSFLSGILFALLMSLMDGFDWSLVMFGPLTCLSIMLILLIALRFSKNDNLNISNLLFLRYFVDKESRNNQFSTAKEARQENSLKLDGKKVSKEYLESSISPEQLEGLPGNSLDSGEPDIEAEFTNHRFTRTSINTGYRGAILIKTNCLISGFQTFLDGNSVEYNNKILSNIKFISPEYYAATLWVGRVLRVQEGNKVVGQIKVTKIYNQSLDRDLAIPCVDAKKVLSNFDLLNKVLEFRLHLTGNLLDLQIMRDFSELSGQEIQNLVDYINSEFTKAYELAFKQMDNATHTFGSYTDYSLRLECPWLTNESIEKLKHYVLFVNR